MPAIFLGYLLLISIGVGVEQVHKAKKDCAEQHQRKPATSGVISIPAEVLVR